MCVRQTQSIHSGFQSNPIWMWIHFITYIYNNQFEYCYVGSNDNNAMNTTVRHECKSIPSPYENVIHIPFVRLELKWLLFVRTTFHFTFSRFPLLLPHAFSSCSLFLHIFARFTTIRITEDASTKWKYCSILFLFVWKFPLASTTTSVLEPLAKSINFRYFLGITQRVIVIFIIWWFHI